MKAKGSLIALLIVLIWCQPIQAQCPELNGFRPAQPGQGEKKPILLVDSLEGNALYSLVPSYEDSGRAKDLCVALFTEKEGDLIASSRTNLKGEFSFQGQVPGRYRLIALSKAMGELNILVELKENPAKEQSQQQRLLLHMRLKNSSSGKSYATLLSVKEYQEREKL